MNLIQYLTANPASDLATTQAYQDVFDNKKIGSGQARGYFVFTGIWTKLRQIQADITNPLYALADATIATATDASSYFGMDSTKADGIANRSGIASYVAAGVMTQAEADGFIAKTLTVTAPFANITKTQFDAAKADIALTGKQNSANTSYNSDATIGYIIKLKSDELIISVIHDLPVTVQTTIQLWAENLDTVSNLYIRENQPMRTLQFEPTAQAKSFRSRQNFGVRKTRIIGVSDKLQSFVIDVKVA